MSPSEQGQCRPERGNAGLAVRVRSLCGVVGGQSLCLDARRASGAGLLGEQASGPNAFCSAEHPDHSLQPCLPQSASPHRVLPVTSPGGAFHFVCAQKHKRGVCIWRIMTPTHACQCIISGRIRRRHAGRCRRTICCSAACVARRLSVRTNPQIPGARNAHDGASPGAH